MPIPTETGKTPLVCVIVPAYNAAKYLSATIESVLAQTLADWELVIVDDGSDDETFRIACEYAEKWPRVHAFTQPNGGPAAARNAGYLRSNPASPYVVFLDGDDCWEPDALSNLAAALEAAPSACGVHGLARLMDTAGQPLPDDEKIVRCRNRKRSDWGAVPVLPEIGRTGFDLLTFENVILTPGVALLRRAAVEEAGLFDTELFGTEDWEMWVRLTRLSPFVFLEKVVLHYRQHPQSVSRNKRGMSRSDLLARKKIIMSPQNTPLQREQGRRGAVLFYSQVARQEFERSAVSLRERRFLPALRQIRYSFLLCFRVVRLQGMQRPQLNFALPVLRPTKTMP